MLSSHDPEEEFQPTREARWGPWNLRPSQAKQKLKILLLHGFASSPRELRPLGQSLAKSGFEVMAPLLPGHGEQFKSLASCSVEDWLEALRFSFAALRRDGSPVAVLGHCLGGSLAIASAFEISPRALICVNTPVTALDPNLLRPWPQNPDQAKQVLDSRVFMNACYSPLAKRWRNLACHHKIPAKLFENYQQTIAMAQSALSKIRCPIYTIQTEQNPIVASTNATAIHSQSREYPSDLLLLEGGSHVPFLDPGRKRLTKSVLTFLSQVVSQETQRF